MYFKSIRKTKHYKEYHEKYFPWSKVIEILLTAKKNEKKEIKLK